MLTNREFHLQTGNLAYKTGFSFTKRESWVTKGILGLLFTEANFYKEDVKVKVKKNDGSFTEITPVWTDTSTDVHIGKVTISAATDHSKDGDYTFSVEYKDRSNNQMNTYTSTTKVIDTTKPVIEVKYANESPANTMTDVENHQRKYFSSTQTTSIYFIA